MAIIVDPDNLDRNQVIFGTSNQKLSLYPVGALAHVSATRTDGATANGTRTFTSAGATFTTWSIAAGDILVIKNKGNAGHYIISSVDSQTQLTLSSTHPTFTGSDTSVTYDIREATGGTIEDGVTLQAVYSFAKEEWRTDSVNVAGDDLIRHPFPFEAITSEQFEIGGGTSHDDWEWFNTYTRKKLRTGGWAAKNLAAATQNEWTGIITLGSLDTDAQVYYQQTSATTAPVNFTFLGPINESVEIFDGVTNYKTYLKLFARKKARTYAQASISDIGVTTIQTIVNRFPLAHIVDSAISDSDAEVLGMAPYRNQASVVTGSNGALANVNGATGTLTSSGATFQTSGVVAGDTLWVKEGTFSGYRFTITAVTSETVVTVSTSEEGPFGTESALDFEITTSIIHATKAAGVASDKTDGALANVSGVTGTLTSAGGGFTAAGVAAGDLVLITEAANVHTGVYKVITRDSDTQLTLNTEDKPFTVQTSMNFRVVEPGMYLQYKKDTVTIGTTGNITFTDNGGSPDTITRASGSWTSDGVTTGTVLVVTGSASNAGSYTVDTVNSATVVTLVPTDSVVTETIAATITAYDGFKRVIGTDTYSFNWRVTGNNTTLSNVYQFIQHQLRQTTDIDYGNGTSRGDITDLLMSFSTPTGTGFNLFIDDLADSDVNNATFRDSTGDNRNFPFLASGTLNFNTNLTGDANAKYWLFFTTNPTGNYGTSTAVVVKDADNNDITGTISGNSSISFTFDYDGNVQGGRTAGTNADVTLIAIGLDTAQFVLAQGTITRSTANSISAVAALERNYSNA